LLTDKNFFMNMTQKSKFLLYALLIAGGTLFASCGGERNNANTDSTTVGGADNAAVTPDTAPAAEIPPGAVNPGEDSSRYGTGTADSSRNRQQ
jgi:hypothetical protein